MSSAQLAELPLEMFQKVSTNGGAEAMRRSVYHLEAEQMMVAEYIDRRGQVVRDYWKRDGGRWVPYLDTKATALH
jgi:hypothetical protein